MNHSVININNGCWKKKFHPVEILFLNIYFITFSVLAFLALFGPYGSELLYALCFIVACIGNFYLLISVDYYLYLHRWTLSRKFDDIPYVKDLIYAFSEKYSIPSQSHEDVSEVKLAKYWFADKYDSVISMNNCFDILIRKTRMIYQKNARILVDISPYRIDTKDEIEKFIDYLEKQYSNQCRYLSV